MYSSEQLESQEVVMNCALGFCFRYRAAKCKKDSSEVQEITLVEGLEAGNQIGCFCL